MRPALLLSGLLFLAPASLAAQTDAAAPPGDQPHILIDTVGPDGWRIRLGPTNLGSLLESEKGRELWEPQVQPFFAMWQQLAGDETAFNASRTRLLEYGGRVRMGLWLDPNDRHRGEPAACIAVVLDGDGRSDLGAIGEDLRATLYATIAGEWADIEVDGATVVVRRNDDTIVTAPMLAGDQLIIAATNESDLALAMRRTRALAESATAAIKPNSPALRVEFDFATILAASMANEPENDRAFMKALGLDTLETGTITLSTAGPRVQFEYSQAFDTDDRGLFSALLPATASIPTLLLAAGAEGTWTVGHFDCLELYETILDAVVAMNIARDEDPRASIKEELGIDPSTDLLAHMTDDVMFWLPEAVDFDEDPVRTPWVLTWRLRDEKAFREGLFAMLPKTRPFFQREATEKYEDVEVFRYGNMLSYDIWLAVGRGVFVIAAGRDAEERVGETLDRCKDLPAELAAEQSLPDGFASLQRFLPEGCHGYSVGTASNVFVLPTGLWFGILSEFTPVPSAGGAIDPDEDVERREALMALLKEHRLDVARSATGYAGRTWRWRLYW